MKEEVKKIEKVEKKVEKVSESPKKPVEKFVPAPGEKALFTDANGNEFVGSIDAGAVVKHSIVNGCVSNEVMESSDFTAEPLSKQELFARLS